MNARVVLAAIAAGFLIFVPPAASAQSATARSSARSCDGNCEQETADLARELARARSELVRLARLLANSSDSLNTRELQSAREELMRAMRSMERLEAQYRDHSGPRVLLRAAPTPQASVGSEGWLGVSFSGNFELIERPGQPRIFRFQAYPVVEAVEPASPARHAGIEVGDVLLRFKQKDLRQEPIALDEMLTPGALLPIVLRRGSRTQTVTVTVGERPRQAFAWSVPMIAPADPPAPIERVRIRSETPVPARAPLPSPPPQLWVVYGSTDVPLAGADMSPVPQDLHQPLGVQGGLLVLKIPHGTPASRAGLREGDVIVRANGKPIRSSGDLQAAIRKSAKRVLSLEVVRKKQTRTVTMEW